jgi:hypothetical protein
VGTAVFANRNASKAQERGATKGANCRQQRTAKTIYRTSQDADDSAPHRSFGEWDVESQGFSLTRKDAPHNKPAELADAPRLMHRVYG